jgi:hypothetical protein
MSSCYAVLGCTGSTGGALVTILLQKPNTNIHAYCRSKQKLLRQFPGIGDNKNVTIFDGPLEDTELIAKCLSGTRAAFLAVALNENQPGCSISIETAKVVVSALKKLRTRDEHLPKLIVLSSSSTEHRLVQQVPQIIESILYRAFSNIYDDLKDAEKYLRSHEELVSSSFIKPSALSHDSRKGHSLSLENSRGPMSFLDLAAGMIEVADDEEGKYDMQSLTVNPTAPDVAFPWEAPGCIFRGLTFHFFPWAYRLLGYP